MYVIATDHWCSPHVSGDKPPPVLGFTLSKIGNEKVMLCGGYTAQGPSSELRVATVLGDSVVSVWDLIYVKFSFDMAHGGTCLRTFIEELNRHHSMAIGRQKR